MLKRLISQPLVDDVILYLAPVHSQRGGNGYIAANISFCCAVTKLLRFFLHFFYTQIFDFHKVLSVNQKIIQLKQINQRIIHGHSPFYVERHSILTPLKTLNTYFSHTSPIILGSGGFWPYIILHDVHACSSPSPSSPSPLLYVIHWRR